MKMPESRYAKTGDVKDHNTFDMDALKQYGRDLLEAAAVEFDKRDNGIGFYEPHEPAEILRKLKEAL